MIVGLALGLGSEILQLNKILVKRVETSIVLKISWSLVSGKFID
jgi:hypothetical protein